MRLFFKAMTGRAPHAGSILAALALFVLAGCAHHAASRKSSAHPPAPPRPAPIGATEDGVASWYGNPYHGRPTASGEIFDMEQLTAAHRTLAFQTWLDVTNLSNGRHVEVRVTDRGPFVDGRVIDLSLAAARQIDMVRTGTARVRLKVIQPPKFLPTESSTTESSAAKTSESQDGAEPPMESPAPVSSPIVSSSSTSAQDIRYTVQAGAFADQSRAEALRDALEARLPESSPVRVVEVAGRPTLWHVLAGSGLSFAEATALAPEVRKAAGAALVVRDPAPRDSNTPDPAAGKTP